MKRHATLFFLVLLLCLGPAAYAQEIGPPSLSVGTSEVLFSKGVLDTELIGEIIAEKQAEIKKAFAKNLLLNKKLSEGPYLTYSYAENVLNALLDHEDKAVMKKALLEHSSELAMVLGITEAYVSIKKKTFAKLERSYLMALGKTKIVRDYDKIVGYDSAKNIFTNDQVLLPSELFSMDKYDQNKASNVTFSIDISTDSSKSMSSGDYLSKISKIYGMRKLGKNQDNMYLHYILLDMFLDICRSNESFQQLGFFQKEFSESTFENRSCYMRFMKNDSMTNQAKKALQADLNKIKQEATVILNLNLKYASIIINQPTSSSNEDKSIALFEKAYKYLLEVSYGQITLTDKEKDLIEKASQLIYFGYDNLRSKNAEDKYDDIVLEVSDVMPGLLALSGKINDEKFKLLINSIDQIGANIRSYQFHKLQQQFLALGYVDEEIKSNLADLFKVLTSLDKAKSFDQISKLIVDVGDVFYDINYTRIMDEIAGIQKYLVIDTDSNRVDIKVEEMLVYLYDKYASETSSQVSLYFTVGYNYLGVLNTNYDISYASEKIGLKLKIYDHYKKRTYNSKYFLEKRKPVINDFYILAFVSGLLYQIDALKSEEDFTQASYGLNVGVHFFNGLDLNSGFTSVQLAGKRKLLFGAGFDIPITEYLSRLGKKNK
jgi:hypothetical protein